MSKNVITVTNLNKSFSQGKEKIDVLKDINLEIKEGELLALMGESGTGKSTLLQILGGIMDHDSGTINFLGENYSKLSESRQTRMRLENMGFVYQYHHLLSDFSALENVMLPQIMLGKDKATATAHAKELLTRLGLEERFHHRPGQLSGGQQQRVAIARALSNDPKIIIADEPSGNLDANNTKIILDLFLALARERNTTLVIATHSEIISKKLDRIFTL